MNAKNIQEYVINHIIQYLEEKDKIIEEQKKLLEEKDNILYCLKKNYKFPKCHHCGNHIFIDFFHENHLLHVQQKFRRCAADNCKFIICGVCAGDFIDPYTNDYTGVYQWNGNPWLGVHPRPIEDDDYICGEEYCTSH